VLFRESDRAAVSRVDVIPAAVLSRQAGEFFEGIDHSGRSGAGDTDDATGNAAGLLVALNLCLQLIRENVKSIVGGNFLRAPRPSRECPRSSQLNSDIVRKRKLRDHRVIRRTPSVTNNVCRLHRGHISVRSDLLRTTARKRAKALGAVTHQTAEPAQDARFDDCEVGPLRHAPAF